MAKDPIKKADNGTYYFRANLGYNPITGKQIQKYRSGFRTKKEAKWILRCGRAASPVWREPPVRTNGATPFCLLSHFAIAGSSPYTSLIERSLDGSTLSISIL